MPPPLLRWLLPFENPIGFGLQDFLELSLAVLIAGFSLVGSRLTRMRAWTGDLLPLLAAFCAAHFLFAIGIGLLRQVPQKRAPEQRLIQRRTEPLRSPAPAPARKTVPPQGKKQVSPFEEVK